MLPRRHILDVYEIVKDRHELLSMSTITLAIDAIKYMQKKPKKDHLVEALELNEFICFMFPMKRPDNRALLYHVVSDLLGLLMYGVPKKSRQAIESLVYNASQKSTQAIESLETINYSEKSMESYPVIEVWNSLKDKVYSKKHGVTSIIDGFIKKIMIEMDVIEQYPFVEDVFYESKAYMKEWLPTFAGYYDKRAKTVNNTYDKWWSMWLCKDDKEKILYSMVDRLCLQTEREFEIIIDKDQIISSIQRNKEENKKENQRFSKWYQEGVNLLLKI
ncbi:MAG: hypothetical protein WCQ90_05790 [Deltaproteobacteria bacterium]